MILFTKLHTEQNHLSILLDDISFRSDLVLKVIQNSHSLSGGKGGWGRHMDVSSWRLYPTYQPQPQQKGEKRTKLTILDPFLLFRSHDGHAAPTTHISGSITSYIQVFRSPHKNNSKGVRSGDLGDRLTSSISISWHKSYTT